eukprot:TRINITY_DN16934_c0_g1_i1.p1 TRINITY_DN16934_c0_g1~~TRINITY_DN16934_c0_g1_i1.p1  ORF type:complete len:80 (-),score=6.15 TRINITY_DN16934_c0_g1_i1:84-323(-)
MYRSLSLRQKMAGYILFSSPKVASILLRLFSIFFTDWSCFSCKTQIFAFISGCWRGFGDLSDLGVSYCVQSCIGVPLEG